MTDNEIIKALECCIAGGEDDCLLCPLYSKKYCTYEKDGAIADLINRQRAEIEKYKTYYETMETELDSFRKDQAEVKFLKNRIRAEAIKEFAGRVKQLNNSSLIMWNEQIDNLAKEMTGDQSRDK